MTDEEIRREYRLAKDPAKQIQILADENNCSAREIRDILRAGGLAVPGRPPKNVAAVRMDGISSGDSCRLPPKEGETAEAAEPESPPMRQVLLSVPAKDATALAEDAAEPVPENGAEVISLEANGARSVRCWLPLRDVSRLYYVLGKLQGVLEASAEAGRPGEVMRDACDELEIILFGIRPEEDPSREGIHPSESSSGCKPGT